MANPDRNITIHNRSVFRRLRFLLYLSFTLIGADIVLSRLPGALGGVAKGHVLFGAGLVLLLIILFMRFRLFVFELSHEMIYIESRPLRLLPIKKPQQEIFNFPKRKVYAANFVQVRSRKYLEIKLFNKRQERKKMRRIDITFLTKKKQAALKAALLRLTHSNRSNSL